MATVKHVLNKIWQWIKYWTKAIIMPIEMLWITLWGIHEINKHQKKIIKHKQK